MDGASTADSRPASALSVSDVREDGSDRPKKARRTFLTQNACTRCRQKKSKCDGQRPVCGRCEKNGGECVYDVAQEGMTRMQNLQQQLDQRNEELGQLMALFQAFRNGTDEQAANLLARIRLGEDTRTLLTDAQTFQRRLSRNMDGSTRMQGLRSAGPRRGMPTSPLDQRRWASWSSQSGPDGQQTDGLPQETRFRGLRPIDTSGYTGHWQHDQVNGMDGADGVDGVDGISETDGDHESQESLPQQTQNPYYSPYMREDEQISPSSRAPSHSFYRASDPAARSPGVERQFAVTQRPHAPQSSQGGSRRPSGSGGQGSGQRRR